MGASSILCILSDVREGKVGRQATASTSLSRTVIHSFNVSERSTLGCFNDPKLGYSKRETTPRSKKVQPNKGGNNYRCLSGLLYTVSRDGIEAYDDAANHIYHPRNKSHAIRPGDRRQSWMQVCGNMVMYAGLGSGYRSKPTKRCINIASHYIPAIRSCLRPLALPYFCFICTPFHS